uniref:UDENN FNIP1/2-type domain-containing protein n=1 Tax=Timema shepardi TaxID=629360 RepID=A0A7R9AQE2_TIMSH|nr:unnamed protein product [Timema shepardi]
MVETTELSSMSSSHPYNPLWAQLSDLCGTLGHPPKIARTIVTSTKGKRTDVVNKILNSLTYFIRCGEVEKKSKECHYRQKMPVGFASSLLGGLSDHYVSDFVLQGCTQNVNEWEMILRKDLSLAAHHTLIDQNVSEATGSKMQYYNEERRNQDCLNQINTKEYAIGLCEYSGTPSFEPSSALKLEIERFVCSSFLSFHLMEVQLVSSHPHIVDKPGMFGVRVGMSQLVANMLESLLHLWKLQTPPEHCLLHLESKLRELCLRSQALADLLLNTEFCDMELLTSSLDLEANDVPLLLAVASTHSPEVTHRYVAQSAHSVARTISSLDPTPLPFTHPKMVVFGRQHTPLSLKELVVHTSTCERPVTLPADFRLNPPDVAQGRHEEAHCQDFRTKNNKEAKLLVPFRSGLTS